MRRVLTLGVIDDDVHVRTALGRLLRSLGHTVRLFGSAEEYEAGPAPVDCLILDIQLPGLNGVELHERMLAAGLAPPVVFITGHFTGEEVATNMPTLRKPFEDDALVAAIAGAVAARGRQ